MASAARVHHSADPSSCNCAFCQNDPLQQPDRPQNPYDTVPTISNILTMPTTGKELVRLDRRDDEQYETASDSDREHANQDQAIRQAPYLPRIQVWARKDGPYTLKVGDQWFHCDDLLINSTEYREATKAPSRYQPQQVAVANQSAAAHHRSRRPQPVRTASQQLMQNAHSAKEAEEARRRKAEHDKTLDRRDEYNRQQAEAAKRKADRTREQEAQAQKQAQADRERRLSQSDNQTPRPDPRQLHGILGTSKQARPQRPRMVSRRSTQDGSIAVPVRTKPKRVRFAKNT